MCACACLHMRGVLRMVRVVPRMLRCKKRKLICNLVIGLVLLLGVQWTLTGNGTHYVNTYRHVVQVTEKGNGDVHTTDGYRLAKSIHERCETRTTFKNITSVNLDLVLKTTSGDLQVCPIWKIGHTLLRRLFSIKNSEKYQNTSNPYIIRSIDSAKTPKGIISNSNSTKRFMFARNPYKRLFSAYVDKLLAPNPVYWNIIGIRAIKVIRKNADEKSLKCGHDLEFHEFIKYVILALTPGSLRTAMPDYHFIPMTKLCQPCRVNFTFIGKLETFGRDSLELVRQLDLPQVEQLLIREGEDLAADDALRDTTYQPFDKSFKNRYIHCISVREALERAWKKLQIRGIIGRQKLILTEKEIDEMTFLKLTELARAARKDSTKAERKEVQREYFLKLYSSVTVEDLHQIRRLYADDFKLFEYDESPPYLFNVSSGKP